MVSPKRVTAADLPTTCPDCGSELSRKIEEQKHSNGHWNVAHQFNCGKDLKFSPNFMAILEEAPCQRNTAFREKTKKREDLKDKLTLVTLSSNVDEEFKDKMQKAILEVRSGHRNY